MIQVSVKKTGNNNRKASPTLAAREEQLSLVSGALDVGNVSTIAEVIDEDHHPAENANLARDNHAKSFNLGSISITDEIDPVSPRIQTRDNTATNDGDNEVFMNVPRLAAMLTVNHSRGNNHYARVQDLQHKRMEEALTIRRAKRPLSAPRTVIPKRVLPERGANIYLPNGKSLPPALVARKVNFRPDKRVIEIDPAILTQPSPFNSPRGPETEQNNDKLQQLLQVSLEEYYAHQAPGGSLWQKPGAAVQEQPLAKQLFPSLTLSAVQSVSSDRPAIELDDSRPRGRDVALPLSARLPLPDQVKHALAVHGQGQGQSSNSTAPNSVRPLSSRAAANNKHKRPSSATATTRRSAPLPEEAKPPQELIVDHLRSDNNPLPRPFRRPGLPGSLRRGRTTSPPPPPHHNQHNQQQQSQASVDLYTQHKLRDMEQLTKLFQFADLQVVSGAGIQEALQLSDSMLIGDHYRDPDTHIHGDHYSNYYYNTYYSKHDTSNTQNKSRRSRGHDGKRNNNNMRSQSPPSPSSALVLTLPKPAETSPSIVVPSGHHEQFPMPEQQSVVKQHREQALLHQPKHPIAERPQSFPSISSPRRALMQRAHEIVLEHERNLLKSGYDVPISILAAAVNSCSSNNNQDSDGDQQGHLLPKDMQIEMQRQVGNFKQITNQEKRPASPLLGSAPPLQFAPEFYNHLHLHDDGDHSTHDEEEVPIQLEWKQFLNKPATKKGAAVILTKVNDNQVSSEPQPATVSKGYRPQSTFQSSATAHANNKSGVKELLPLLPPNAIGASYQQPLQQNPDLVPLLSFTAVTQPVAQDTIPVKINRQVISPRLDDKINAANADYRGQAPHQPHSQHAQMIASPPPSRQQSARPRSAVVLSRTNCTIANSKALPGRMLQRDPQSPEPSSRRHDVDYYGFQDSELKLPSGAEGVAMLQQLIEHDHHNRKVERNPVAAIADERAVTAQHQSSSNPSQLVELVDASTVHIIQRREHPLRDQQKMYGQYVKDRNYDRQVKKLSKQHPNNHESKVTIASSSMKVPAMKPAPPPSQQAKGKVGQR